MKNWSVKNAHENSNWVKICPSMNSTLRNFCKGDAILGFLTGSFLGSPNVGWNKKLMKIWLVKITHENQNWMKNWLSMDSTLRNFSKTNSSSWLRKFFTFGSRWLFGPGAGFVILRNQNVTPIEIREKMEDLGEKMKTYVSKISPGSRSSV